MGLKLSGLNGKCFYSESGYMKKINVLDSRNG